MSAHAAVEPAHIVTLDQSVFQNAPVHFQLEQSHLELELDNLSQIVNNSTYNKENSVNRSPTLEYQHFADLTIVNVRIPKNLLVKT